MKSQLVWCPLRIIFFKWTQWIPAIHCNGEQNVTLLRDRVAAHHVVDGQCRHADTNANSDSRNHQSRHDRVAPHAFEGEFQIVFKHLNGPVQSCAANG